MIIIVVLLILLGIPLIIFSLSKVGKTKKTEKKNQEKARHEAGEKVMRPERKLHAEEKKRWEDEYWKRQEKRDR